MLLILILQNKVFLIIFYPLIFIAGFMFLQGFKLTYYTHIYPCILISFAFIIQKGYLNAFIYFILYLINYILKIIRHLFYPYDLIILFFYFLLFHACLVRVYWKTKYFKETRRFIFILQIIIINVF